MKKKFLTLMVVGSLLVAACGQAPKKAAENTEAEIEAVADDITNEIEAAADSIANAVEEAAEAVEEAVEAAK